MQQMLGECDGKLAQLTSEYEGCALALHEDFRSTVSQERTAVAQRVEHTLASLGEGDPSNLLKAMATTRTKPQPTNAEDEISAKDLDKIPAKDLIRNAVTIGGWFEEEQTTM